MLGELGRPDLIRQHGHYEVWLGNQVERRAVQQARIMEKLEVATQPAPREFVEAARRAAHADSAAALLFPNCAHVVDPLEVVRAFADAARARGARFLRQDVRALRASRPGVEIVTDSQTMSVSQAIVCTGVWSAPLLAPFGLKIPWRPRAVITCRCQVRCLSSTRRSCTPTQTSS